MIARGLSCLIWNTGIVFTTITSGVKEGLLFDFPAAWSIKLLTTTSSPQYFTDIHESTTSRHLESGWGDLSLSLGRFKHIKRPIPWRLSHPHATISKDPRGSLGYKLRSGFKAPICHLLVGHDLGPAVNSYRPINPDLFWKLIWNMQIPSRPFI